MPNKDDLIGKDCWLYSIWSGKFRCYLGDVYQHGRDKATASFRTKKPIQKHFLCSSDDETIYNGVVWLREKDDLLALEYLITNEENAIDALREKIDNHQHKMIYLLTEKENLKKEKSPNET